MSELHLLCDNLFARCEDPAPDGVRGSRLMQPLSDRKGFELKTFPKDARDIFLIGWQLENGNALRAFLLTQETFFGYHYGISELSDTQPHTHDYLELGYVLDGSFRQVIEGKSVTFQKGEFCLIDTRSVHSDKLEGTAEVLFFGISNRMFDIGLNGDRETSEVLTNFMRDALLSQKEANQYIRFVPDDRIRNVASRTNAILESLIEELLYRDAGTEYITFGLVTRLLHTLTADYEFTLTKEQVRQRTQMTGDEVLQYIADHFRDISIAELETRFHYNADYFNRLILKRKDMTYSEYVQALRLEQACRMLTETELGIDDVVHDAGYNNKGYFYKIFKEKYGCTPAEYRGRFTSSST